MKSRRKTGSAPKQAASRTAAPRIARTQVRSAGSVARPRAVVSSLAADCTITNAADMHKRLARVIAKPAGVTLDLAAVRRIDTAGLQVLAAFIRERQAAGHAVQCQGATSEFLNTTKLLGLGALFDAVMDARPGTPADHA